MPHVPFSVPILLVIAWLRQTTTARGTCRLLVIPYTPFLARYWPPFVDELGASASTRYARRRSATPSEWPEPSLLTNAVGLFVSGWLRQIFNVSPSSE